MRERLTLVQGELVVESRPDTGTTITARVPVSVGNSAADAALPLDPL
jgi:signal transduction histidine kinase